MLSSEVRNSREVRRREREKMKKEKSSKEVSQVSDKACYVSNDFVTAVTRHITENVN
jgi:hypothetical protein